jgi:DNA-binding beta-propeller fold protein YncE
VVGRLRATIWVPRVDRGGARVCRTGFRRFDMTVTGGAPTAHGALRQLDGPAGCVTPRGGGGCTPARGSVGIDLIASPDGRHVYTAGSGGVFAFSRDPQTGALSPLDGSSACLTAGGDPGCAPASRMRAPHGGLAFSPDGTSLYVAWADYSVPGMPRSGLSVLRRDPGTGTLTELAGEGGCLDTHGMEGCTPWRNIFDSTGIAAAPDGRHVYVGTQGFGDFLGEPRVAMLDVDPATGGLRPPDRAGCPGALADPERESPCAPFAGSSIITFVGGGLHVYTADQALSRDPETGLLTPMGGRKGCYFVPDRQDPELDPRPGSCTSLRAFFGYVEGVVATPDGRQIYMTDEGTAVGGFNRNPATGRLSPIRVLGGCARAGAGAGCSHSRAFEGPNGLAMAPDGRTIYAAGYQTDSVAVFNRDARTGALRQLAGRNGCVSGGNRRENKTLLCSAARALRFPWDMIVSPDGLNIYVLTNAGIAVFARRAG